MLRFAILAAGVLLCASEVAAQRRSEVQGLYESLKAEAAVRRAASEAAQTVMHRRIARRKVIETVTPPDTAALRVAKHLEQVARDVYRKQLLLAQEADRLVVALEQAIQDALADRRPKPFTLLHTEGFVKISDDVMSKDLNNRPLRILQRMTTEDRAKLRLLLKSGALGTVGANSVFEVLDIPGTYHLVRGYFHYFRVCLGERGVGMIQCKDRAVKSIRTARRLP